MNYGDPDPMQSSKLIMTQEDAVYSDKQKSHDPKVSEKIE